MTVSCGVLFLRNGKILLGHTTGQAHWDIPKGKCESGENYIEAAIRETMEETNVHLVEDDLSFLGKVPYRQNKSLVLFLYKGSNFPKVEDCVCTSTFMSPCGHEKPELDEFRYVDYTDLKAYVTERLLNAIHEALAKVLNDDS